jgi:putative ABC transport system permease protein
MNVATLRAQLLADPAVRQVLPKIEFSGLISNGDKSTVMMAAGVEPDSEFGVKGPFLTITDGRCWHRAALRRKSCWATAWPRA